MMIKSWILLFASLVFFQNVAKADAVYTTVFNVFESLKTERLLVLSAVDGRIYKTPNTAENIEKMNMLIGRIVRLDYTKSGNEAIITNIRSIYQGEIDTATLDLNRFTYNELRQFAPTDLKSVEKATEVFNNMLNDGDKSRSQCFKRAHMWSYDMWSKSGINSQKLFIFWSKRYQILEEFDWWFHVAPMVVVNGEEYVMDGTFMKKPIPVLEWRNYFMKTDKITCPVVDTFQEIEAQHWTRLCFLMKVPMYHLSPLDIQFRDLQGIERNHWVLEELQDARKAFKGWDKTYEGLDTGKYVRKF